jgi:hypothetical protein
MTPIDGLTSHPLGPEPGVQRAPEHACRQFRFAGKGDLFWHMGGSPSLWILGPTLGQIQFAIHKGLVALAGIGQKDADLTVFNASCRPTVLALHPDRLLPLFEKAGFINDQHPIGIGKQLSHIGLELIAHLVALPDRSIEQILHRIRRRESCFFCQLPPIFAFDGTQSSS